jgi:hypothetical protein
LDMRIGSSRCTVLRESHSKLNAARKCHWQDLAMAFCGPKACLQQEQCQVAKDGMMWFTKCHISTHRLVKIVLSLI